MVSDVRSNVTLACPHTQSPGSTLLWGHNVAGRPNWEIMPDSRHRFLSNGALVIGDVQMSDHGNYSCHHNNTSNAPLTTIQLVVQGRRSSCNFIPFSSALWSVAYGGWKFIISHKSFASTSRGLHCPTFKRKSLLSVDNSSSLWFCLNPHAVNVFFEGVSKSPFLVLFHFCPDIGINLTVLRYENNQFTQFRQVPVNGQQVQVAAGMIVQFSGVLVPGRNLSRAATWKLNGSSHHLVRPLFCWSVRLPSNLQLTLFSAQSSHSGKYTFESGTLSQSVDILVTGKLPPKERLVCPSWIVWNQLYNAPSKSLFCSKDLQDMEKFIRV